MSMDVYLRVYGTAASKERHGNDRTRHGLYHLQSYRTDTEVRHSTAPYCGVCLRCLQNYQLCLLILVSDCPCDVLLGAPR
jgi:hypothetical protein